RVRNAHAREESGDNHVVGVRKHGPQLNRASVGIDLVAEVVDPSGVGEARLSGEAEKSSGQTLGVDRALLALELPALEDFALAGGEIHVNRILLDDRGEERRLAAADEIADVDVVAVYTPIDRREDLRVGEIEVRGFEVRPCHCQLRLREISGLRL